jgi:uncharacterized protein YjbI with pentapeptide repeats
MANPEHLAILKQGVDVWNEWRAKTAEQVDLCDVDFRGADLCEVNLSGAFLCGANLSFANLSEANLYEVDFTGANFNGANLCKAFLKFANLNDAYLFSANLNGANLGGADLWGADLSEANLSNANLSANFREANLSGANLSYAGLSGADLSRASLSGANLNYANLSGGELIDTDFTNVSVGTTVFANVDFSTTEGLASVRHRGPSTIGIDTLYKSRGQIPEIFLRGCGVPDSFITQAKSLIGAEEGIQFYSCFISYSTQDDEFARRLHARLQQEHLRVWFSPHDIHAGQKLHDQIDQAIKVYDKLLLLLTPHSMQSPWVITEIRKALKAERKARKENSPTGQRKLFPLRLMDYDQLKDWECFDADTGADLAVEVREYFIPDFTHWKDHDTFEAAFSRLLQDLRLSTQPAPRP